MVLLMEGDHPSLQKSDLLMVAPEEKWGPVKLKSHYGEGGSPPSEKLFLAQLVSSEPQLWTNVEELKWKNFHLAVSRGQIKYSRWKSCKKCSIFGVPTVGGSGFGAACWSDFGDHQWLHYWATLGDPGWHGGKLGGSEYGENRPSNIIKHHRWE